MVLGGKKNHVTNTTLNQFFEHEVDAKITICTLTFLHVSNHTLPFPLQMAAPFPYPHNALSYPPSCSGSWWTFATSLNKMKSEANFHRLPQLHLPTLHHLHRNYLPSHLLLKWTICALCEANIFTCVLDLIPSQLLKEVALKNLFFLSLLFSFF